MEITSKLIRIIDEWNLLNHPFYQAWSSGTLPLEALRVYAREYGEFISALPQGWETLKDHETANEEREHIQLWENFGIALGIPESQPPIMEAKELTRTARKLFSTPASALGALYAFEVQQPATAQSKLNGLRTHYHFTEGVEPYFETHSSNWHESEKILAQINKLSPAEQEQALLACEQMATSLWNALTGIHEATCQPGKTQ